MRGRGGEKGCDLLLKLLEGVEDHRSVGSEGDEVCGSLPWGSNTTLRVRLLHR